MASTRGCRSLQGYTEEFVCGIIRLYVFAHNERPSSQKEACAARGARVLHHSRRCSSRIFLPAELAYRLLLWKGENTRTRNV